MPRQTYFKVPHVVFQNTYIPQRLWPAQKPFKYTISEKETNKQTPKTTLFFKSYSKILWYSPTVLLFHVEEEHHVGSAVSACTSSVQ